jgi:hypothetical protein
VRFFAELLWSAAFSRIEVKRYCQLVGKETLRIVHFKVGAHSGPHERCRNTPGYFLLLHSWRTWLFYINKCTEDRDCTISTMSSPIRRKLLRHLPWLKCSTACQNVPMLQISSMCQWLALKTHSLGACCQTATDYHVDGILMQMQRSMEMALTGCSQYKPIEVGQFCSPLRAPPLRGHFVMCKRGGEAP